ncbi:MAG: efflux RND transporter periplasmic adaptor subunit [Candidatus Methylomirabilota bacterium]|jgi:membrane fusion protein (multidrug efflux system)
MPLLGKADGRGNLIVVAAVLVCGLWLGGCESSKSAPPPSVPEVATVTVQPEQVVLTTELPGRTSAYSMAEIRPQVGGIIQKRLFEEGADIRDGQALYEIDPAPLQAAYDNAAANLAAARRAVARAQAALEASHTGVLRQRAIVENARVNRKRFEDLLAEGAVAASQRDQAVTDADVADATLRTTQAQVESDREAVAVAEATVQQAAAALEAARINLGYARVTAPIAGRIGKSSVTVGALVTASQPTPLATIQQLDPIYVDVTQSSANLLQLKRNIAVGRIKGDGPDRARVKLLLEDGTPYPSEGTLKFSDVTVDPSTGSFILRMLFPNPQHTLLPGMFVRAQVLEGVVEQAILVPQQGVSRDPKGNPLVLLVGAESKVEQRMIAVDRAIGDRWLVASGLAPGDQVIVEGIQKVRPGASVKAVPFDAGRKESPEAGKIGQPATGAK